jgi:hypothetical protein
MLRWWLLLLLCLPLAGVLQSTLCPVHFLQYDPLAGQAGARLLLSSCACQRLHAIAAPSAVLLLSRTLLLLLLLLR